MHYDNTGPIYIQTLPGLTSVHAFIDVPVFCFPIQDIGEIATMVNANQVGCADVTVRRIEVRDP